MENKFDKLAEEFEVKEETKNVHEDRSNNEEELGIDAFNQQEYIKSPEVGESIEFTVDKIVKNKNTEGTNKDTGEKFAIGCTRKDGTVIRYDIITTDNGRFTINSWSLFYLFMGKNSDFAKAVTKRQSYKGIKVKLTRNYDGSVPNKKTSDVLKLYDNVNTLEEAEAYKKEVAKALKDGTLYTLEIL